MLMRTSCAMQVLSKLGYTRVTELDHGQTVTVAGGRMTVTAVEGAFCSYLDRHASYLPHQVEPQCA